MPNGGSQPSDYVFHIHARVARLGSLGYEITSRQSFKELIVGKCHQPMADTMEALVTEERIQSRAANDGQILRKIRGTFVSKIGLRGAMVTP